MSGRNRQTEPDFKELRRRKIDLKKEGETDGTDYDTRRARQTRASRARTEACRSRNCLTTNQGCPRIASFDQRVPCNGKRRDTVSILRQVHVAAVPADGARQGPGTNDCPSRCETIRLPLCLAPERSRGTQRRSHRSTDRRSRGGGHQGELLYASR